MTLVNRYAEVSEKKRILNEEIDSELAKIEEALYAFAQKGELGAIFGSDHVARVKVEVVRDAGAGPADAPPPGGDAKA